MAKKYVSLSRLSTFLDNLKNIFVSKTDVNAELAKKADSSHTHSIGDTTNLQSTLDGKVPTSRTINSKPLSANITLSASDVGAAPSSHNHDDRYYTETEIDTKLAGKSDTTHNHDTKYDSKGSASAVQENLDVVSDTLNDHTSNTDIHFTALERTKLSGIATGAQVNTVTGVKGGSESTYRTGNINITKANIGLGNVDNTADANKSVKHATSADSATSATKATQDGNGKVISSTYETKSDASAKLTEAKTYADNAANTVKNDLLNNAGAAYDTLKELGDLIDDNKDAIDALNDVAAGKANATHTHAISDVTNLQSTLDGKAEKSHGAHVSYSTAAPVMDGTASVGSASTVARSDHKHPTDTSRASKTEFDSHTADTTAHMTSTQKTQLSTAYNHSQAAHAPSNAQANQNAFSNIAVSGQTTVAADTTTDTVTFVGSNVSITTDATNDKVTFSVADGTTGAKGVVQLTNSTSSTSTTTAATPSSVKSAYDLANTAKTNAATAQTKADSAYALAESKVDKNHTHSWNDLQNKPFGDEIESEETLMSNKTISMYGDGWYRVTPVVELIEGITYKVTFNGTTYESVAWVSPTTGTICIGNGEIYGGEDYGNWNAPFAFEYNNGAFSLYSNEIGSATFSIIKVVADVTKLDDRFIPDTIARTSDVSQVQIITYEADD